MRELLPVLRLHRTRLAWLIGGAVLMLLATLSAFGLLALSGWFIAATGLAGLILAAGGTTTLEIFGPGAGIRAFAVGRAVFRYGERVTTHEAVLRLLADLRVWVFRRLLRLDLERLGRLHSGEALARITADVDRLDQLYLRIIAPVAVALLGLLASAAVLAFFAPVVAVTTTAVLGAVAVAAAVITGPLAARPGERVITLAGTLRERTVEMVQGLAELRVCGASSRALERLGALSRDQGEADRRLLLIAGATGAAGTLAAHLAVWLAAILAVPLVQAGVLTGPGYALLLLGVLALGELVTPLPLAAQTLGSTRLAARRVTALAPEPAGDTDNSAHAPAPVRGDAGLALEGVTFRYHAAAEPVLNNADLTIAPGEHVAITGPSGTGKSTLVSLLLGARSPETGSVRIGGLAPQDLPPGELGTRLTWLPQRTILFAGSVADNLRLAAPEASADVLWRALRAAELDTLVAGLPEQLETWLGTGGRTLSGGESRRLALARTLLAPAPIVLLDEPTRGLEAATARRVAANLTTTIGPGRTLVVITHAPELLPDTVRRVALVDGRFSP